MDYSRVNTPGANLELITIAAKVSELRVAIRIEAWINWQGYVYFYDSSIIL